MIKVVSYFKCFRAILLLALFAGNVSSQTRSPINVDSNTLPATGQQQTILSTQEFGRYSVQAYSEQGTALQIVDRMLGPQTIIGQAGEKNGRWDGFLDRGQYKVITYSHPKGLGNTQISAHPFTSLNNDTAEQLISYKLIDAQLGDLQQREYWLVIEKRETVFIEAAGRSLADLRLWKDGTWLVDAEPQSGYRTPSPGKPLQLMTLVADLNPGLYQLIAYGGIALDWSKSSEQQPFYLRMGLPTLAQNGRQQFTMSPFGVDRYLVPAKADFFRLELDKSDQASINVGLYDENNPTMLSGSSQTINKNSLLPAAEIKSYSHNQGFKLVAINTEAGKPYTLQHFFAVRRVVIDPGRYFVSSLHAGPSEDSIEATAVLTDHRYYRQRFVDDRAITINQNQTWHRHFNLLEKVTLFVEVNETGEYLVSGTGVNAHYRFEPFLTRKPIDYKIPELRDLNTAWHLDNGYYVLTIQPKTSRSGNTGGKGIANIAITRNNPAFANQLLQQPTESGAGFVRFKEISVSEGDHYTLYLNDQPGVVTGIDVRPLPVDLTQDFGLTLLPNETLELDVNFPTDGELSVKAENREPVEFSVFRYSRSQEDRASTEGPKKVKAGIHSLQIKNPSAKNQSLHLRFVDQQHTNSAALPSIDKDILDQVPAFPLVQESKPYFLETERLQTNTLNIDVTEPALYRIESMGLLQTQGLLRTRVNTKFDQQENNGVGRNFLIQQYLREGAYQISVLAQGKTQGNLGVRLEKNSLRQGGKLSNGIPARYTLPSGSGLIYEFDITTAGNYELQSYGLNGSFSIRLEDEDGWPLLRPGVNSYIQKYFAIGRYRYIILPGALQQRVITELKFVPTPIDLRGHGPFPLALGQTMSHRWLEPIDSNSTDSNSTANESTTQLPDQNNRLDDQWDFTLSSPATTSIDLSIGMIGELVRLETGEILTSVSGAVSNKIDLETGSYRLYLRSARIDNRFDYTVEVNTEQLLVGQQRLITIPSTTVINIGNAGLTEVTSAGQKDVKAKLLDANAKVVAQNDDRTNDWNFSIARYLQAGSYTLQVDSPDGQTGNTFIKVFQPNTVDHPASPLPLTNTIVDSDIHRYPFMVKSGKQLLVFSAESEETVGLSLEKYVNQRWEHLTTVNNHQPLLTIGTDNSQNIEYRLSVWSPEKRELPIEVAMNAIALEKYDEYQWSKGITTNSVSVGNRKISASLINLIRPGIFQNLKVFEDSSQLLWSPSVDTLLLPATDQFNSADSNQLLLVTLGDERKSQARRIQLNSKADVLLSDSASLIDSVSENNDFNVFVGKARTGPVGITVLQNKNSRNTMGIDGNSAVTVFNNNSNKNTNLQIGIWKANGNENAVVSTIIHHQLNKSSKPILNPGITDLKVDPNAAFVYPLTSGRKSLTMTLAPKTGAALYNQDHLMKVFWARQDYQNYRLMSDADQIVFFNTNEKIQPFSLLLMPPTTDQPSLTTTKLFKQYEKTTGILDLNIEAELPNQLRLSAYGNAELTVIHENGKIEHGVSTTLSPNSRLLVNHKPGFIALWLTDVSGTDWPKDLPQATPLSLNSIWNLDDLQNRGDITLNQTQFVRVESTQPLLVRKQNPLTETELTLHPIKLNDVWVLHKGRNKLLVEGLGNNPSNDSIDLQALTPIPIKEGLSEPFNVSTGEAKLFSFVVNQKTTPFESKTLFDIGVGVRASTDIARCRLYDQEGQFLGQGVTQFHQLSNGQYYLLIDVPNDGKSLSVQAAVVGLETPSTLPSEKTKQEFQQLLSPDSL